MNLQYNKDKTTITTLTTRTHTHFTTSSTRQYFFSQSVFDKKWFIRELLDGGKLGDVTASGQFQHFFNISLSFSIGANTYLYVYSTDSNEFIVYSINPSDGSLQSTQQSGKWDKRYDSQAIYQTDAGFFIYSHSTEDLSWKINGVNIVTDGNICIDLSKATDSGKWFHPYDLHFAYAINGKVFIYGSAFEENKNEKFNWFTQEICNDTGKMGKQQQFSDWNFNYPVQFPIFMESNLFFFGASAEEDGFSFIQQIDSNGHVGDEVESGVFKPGFAFKMIYQFGGNYYLLGETFDTSFTFRPNSDYQIHQLTKNNDKLIINKNATETGSY